MAQFGDGVYFYVALLDVVVGFLLLWMIVMINNFYVLAVEDVEDILKVDFVFERIK